MIFDLLLLAIIKTLNGIAANLPDDTSTYGTFATTMALMMQKATTLLAVFAGSSTAAELVVTWVALTTLTGTGIAVLIVMKTLKMLRG